MSNAEDCPPRAPLFPRRLEDVTRAIEDCPRTDLDDVVQANRRRGLTSEGPGDIRIVEVYTANLVAVPNDECNGWTTGFIDPDLSGFTPNAEYEIKMWYYTHGGQNSVGDSYVLYHAANGLEGLSPRGGRCAYLNEPMTKTSPDVLREWPVDYPKKIMYNLDDFPESVHAYLLDWLHCLGRRHFLNTKQMPKPGLCTNLVDSCPEHLKKYVFHLMVNATWERLCCSSQHNWVDQVRCTCPFHRYFARMYFHLRKTEPSMHRPLLMWLCAQADGPNGVEDPQCHEPAPEAQCPKDKDLLVWYRINKNLRTEPGVRVSGSY